MKSRKIFLSVLALALVGTVVASCGGDKPSSSLTTSEQPQTSETTSSVEEVKTKAVYTGLGSVVGLGYSRTNASLISQVNITTAAASFDEDGKVISVQFDVVQAPVVIDGTNVVLDTTQKQTKDAGDKVIETKQELLDRYGMLASSGIEKEVYEQMRAFADFVEGKTIAEVIDYGYKKRDDSHTYVPDGGELATKVTITVQDYVAALMEAYETKKAAVEVPETVEISTGIGMTFTAKANQIDVYVASISIGNDDVIYGAYVDTLQVALKVEDELIALDGSKAQVKDAGFKVLESKKELGYRYGMYYRGSNGEFTLNPNASGEWFEQAEAIENWLVGQDIDVLDFAETKFPSGHDLAAKVTITVDGYFGVFAEAATYAKALPVEE